MRNSDYRHQPRRSGCPRVLYHQYQFLKSEKSWLQHLPAWFMLFSVLVYGSGFLILQRFYDGYGLRGMDTELFKIRFIDVGLLFMIVPICVGGFVISICFWFHIVQKATWKGAFQVDKFTPFAITVCSIIITQFWIVVVFITPEKFKDIEQWVIATIILILLVIPTACLSRQSKSSESKNQHSDNSETPGNSNGTNDQTTKPFKHPVDYYSIIMYLFGIALLVCLGFTVRAIHAYLYEILCHNGLWFILLSAFLGFMIWRLVSPTERRKHSVMNQVRTPIGFIFVFIVYCGLMELFAYGMFNYIPAGAGGGDFSYAGRIKVKCVQGYDFPKWLFNNNKAHRLVLIESTESSIFVANPYELPPDALDVSGEPPQQDINGSYASVWRQSRLYHPRVAEIRMKYVQYITHFNRPDYPVEKN